MLSVMATCGTNARTTPSFLICVQADEITKLKQEVLSLTMELDSYERLEADYARLKKQLEIYQVYAAPDASTGR